MLTTSGIVTIIIGSFLTMAVSPGLISVAGMGSMLVPKWLAWFGLIVGVLNITWLGFFWLPGFRPGEALFFIPFVAYGLSLVWQVILGVIMMRYRAPKAVLEAELQTS